MNISQSLWLSSILIIFSLSAAAFCCKGKARHLTGNILLLVVSAFVITFLSMAASGGKIMKTNVTASADQAEMQLRIFSCIFWMEKFTDKSVPESLRRKSAEQAAAQAKQQEQIYRRLEETLRAAAKQSPGKHLYQAKLVIVLSQDNLKQHQKEIEDISNQLVAIPALAGSDEWSWKQLGTAFKEIYIQGRIGKSAVESVKKNLESILPIGWYRNNALLALYKASGASREEKALLEAMSSQYMIVFVKLVTMLVIMVVSGIVGLINLFVQLGLVSREKVEPVDAPGISVPIKVIYTVFIGWFACYVLISLGFHYYAAYYPAVSTQPELIAVSTAITYFLGNLPGPLLIYFLAFKPRQMPFWQTLRLQWKTANAGPVKLMLSAYLAWCTAIPLIAVSALIANRFLGTQGSDSPVINQILLAAGSTNTLPVLLFYFTLGVMAPFFEEILFRGFIYASLRSKIGVPLSMLASAALFAGLHFDRGGVLMLFAIGFVLAYTFERTRSLIPSIIAHGLWNSGTFTLALVLSSI